jgi:hypothetical protein
MRTQEFVWCRLVWFASESGPFRTIESDVGGRIDDQILNAAYIRQTMWRPLKRPGGLRSWINRGSHAGLRDVAPVRGSGWC